jgi:RimJ/RimL family protein N-acetyltransferase
MTTETNSLVPPPAELLPDAVLARRAELPLKPDPVILEGRFVRLEPLDVERHTEALYAVANGSEIHLGGRTYPAYDAEEIIWRYLFSGPHASFAEFRRDMEGQVGGTDRLCLCVLDRESGSPVGAVSFMSNVPAFLRIELGSIWYSPIVQRTQANLESTYLMLAHAFGLGYRRVEWKCDARNERSRRAALRMGFQFEGIQEFHMIVKGRSRDTAWYRMLDCEWPDVRVRLENMLYGRC